MLYKQIVLEWGRDTETGVWGKGYSPDNGEHFYVTDTTFGRKYRSSDADGLWNNGLHEKVKEKVNREITNTVEPAIKQADSAVAYANEAIKKSRVNSQAIVDINSAVSGAVSDAAVARGDGLRAWNAAQSNVKLIDLNYASVSAAISSARTEAIAAADEAKASASAAQADIVAVRPDVTAAKSDIADTKTSLTSQAKSLSSYAAQASAAGEDITTLKSQAGQFEQGMASVKGDVSQLKLSASSASVALSDAAGNISSLQATAKSYSAALSDTNSNVASVTATASDLETKYADAAGDINTLKADAKGFSQTLTDAKGDISTLQDTATGFRNTLTDAQGNISTLQSDVAGLKKTTSDHAGNIATLQADAKTLTSQISDVQGDISTLQQAAEDTDAKITANSTAIDQNKKAIAFKADQTTVDKTNGTVQQLQAQLKVQADQIATKVSSSDLPNLVGGGGRNLLVGSDPTVGTPSLGGVTEVDIDGVKAWKSTGTGYIYFNISLEANTTYTYSALIKADTVGELGFICYGHFQVRNPKAHNQADPTHEDVAEKRDYHGINVPANQWTRIYYTFTTNDLSGSTFGAFPSLVDGNLVNGNNNPMVYVRQLMLEKGTIAHDWQPAPEDSQTYTQTQIKQTADSWNANLTSVKNGLTDKYTNLHATVDGIQAQVYNSDGSSKITQLSNLIASKVSSSDYNSQITQLKNDINLRVTKGNVISQINQEAGGNTLIQVNNGKGSLILDAGNTIVTGKAWIPSAAIANLTADDIKTGTLTGSTVHLDDGNGNTIDLGDLATDYVGFHSKATNGDQTYIDRNGIHNYGATYDTKISQGMITTNLLAVNGGGLIDFRSSGDGTTIDSQNIKFYNSNAVNGGIEFSGGSPLATAQDGAVGNELRVRYDRSFALTPVKDESARICASSAVMQVGFIQSGSSTPDLNTTGLWVDNDNRRVNLGVWGADSTWARMEANTHNIHMQAGNAHAWLSNDNVFHIYKDGDSSSTATKLQVDGWAWINGWVEAAGHSQHSALSTKTDIQPVDDDKMLEMVNDTDLTTFLYKTDVANGETHRHIGLIIDDVHDVAQYQTPQEFIAPNGVSRDDDNMIGALFGAVKALTKRIKTLESKVG